jgi:hypothetical protein
LFNYPYRKLILTYSLISYIIEQHPQRTATDLLNESKAFFVKSQEVLHNQQTLSTNQRIVPSFRIAYVFSFVIKPLCISIIFIRQPRRCPYQFYEYDRDRSQSDPSTPDSIFESVSVLSFSDQTTTFDSTNSPSQRKRTVVSSSVTIIERNARIIKWLFQLHKANDLVS